MQEILVIVAIALVVLFIPRLMNRGKSASTTEPPPRLQPRPHLPSNKPVSRIILTGWMRTVIVITFLWVAGCAAYFKPWEGKTLLFICISLGPAVVVWGSIWAWFGYKKYRR
jgi:hypothetical protein